MDSLTPAEKAQLQEVADLMLEIYRTLVRMRYLDASRVCEGPHDIEAVLPTYRSYGLDDSIIYLYSILPYINTSVPLDFFQGGEFADFRKEEAIKRGRDPFYEDDEDNRLPPYMTPLSLMGNHRSVIFYNSRKHWVAIIDQESEGSSDHNIHEGFVPYESGEVIAWDDEQTSEDEEDGADEGEDEEDGTDEGEDEEDGTNEGEDDDDDSDEEGSPWDELTSRPAGRVLRDIIQWYHDLVEIPGDGEQCAQSGGDQWDPELVKPLYRKHGWPESHFDGDAFVADRDRAVAARED